LAGTGFRGASFVFHQPSLGTEMIRFTSSLRARSIAFVLLAVIPAFAVILFTDQRYRTSIGAQVQKNALGSARIMVAEQRHIFENAHQLLITLAHLPQIREHNSVGCQKILAGLLEPLYFDLGVLDGNGNLRCSARGANTLRSLPLRNTAILHAGDTREFSIGEVQKDSADGKAILQMGLPIIASSGALQGIAFVVLDYSWIVRTTAENHLPSDASFSLFDESGKVFLRYPDNKETDTPIVINGRSHSKLIHGVEGNLTSSGSDQISRLITYRQLDHRLAGKVIYAGIQVPARTAFAEAERTLRENLMILGVLSVLTLIAAWFGADLFVLRRVRDLMSATKQLAAGNLQARTGLPYGESELGHLAKTFDDLAKTLEQRAADAKLAETEIQKQNLRQTAIHEISAAMTSSLDLANVLNALVQGVSSLFPSSYISLSWRNENGTLEPIHFPDGRDKHFMDNERGLAQKVFKLGSPLLIPCVQSDSRTADPDSLRRQGFITYLGLPMIVRGTVLGVLSFYSKEEVDLTADEEGFLTNLTHQAAIALYNSHLYEQTKHQAIELERSNRIKDEFLGVMSHELRTPINVIMNCAEALNMGVFGQSSPEQEKIHEKIRTQSSHLLSLINEILEITKIETGVVTANKERIDIHQLAAELESDYGMVSREKNMSVNWKVAVDLPQIFSDRMKLRQILINLVDNAIKFTDQGSVDICFRSVEQNYIEFYVRDTGIGIAEEFLPQIFEKFRQIDSSTTRHHSGAGLGLYVVKSFVDVLGGTVAVQSQVKEGTTFTVRIPVGETTAFSDDHIRSGETHIEYIAPPYTEGKL
jgi:Osmosensitive K+ channel histidine kinase